MRKRVPHGSDAARGLLCAVSIMLLSAGRAFGAPGELDPTFGNGGKVRTTISGYDDFVSDVAIQGDGKIVVAGTTTSSPAPRPALTRYDNSGNLDPSFGGDGIVRAPETRSFHEVASAMELQPDGRIVTAGFQWDREREDFAIARYGSDGTADSSFGGTGRVVTRLGSGNARAVDVALQADGKIVAVGTAHGEGQDLALVRYDLDGTLDASFGGTGVVTTIGSKHEVACSVAVQSDGKIVVAGTSIERIDHLALSILVARYHPDGTVDTSFGGTGTVTATMGRTDAAGLVLQEDGKIVVVGRSWNGSSFEMLVVRYETDGALDETFGDGGQVTTAMGMYALATSVALQGDGKIVVAGAAQPSSTSGSQFALVRYDSDGTLDTSFGVTGKVTTPMGREESWAYAIELQADGKIVAAGFGGDWFDDHAFMVARYMGPSCGDGVVESFEDCDDGNSFEGDCCSASCEPAPIGTSCLDDDVCNGDETCDGAGTCLPGSQLDCDDGDACTQKSCDPASGCASAAEPATSCIETWERASLLVKEDVPGQERLMARFVQGPALSRSKLGDPLEPSGTAFTACIYGDERLAAKLEVDRAAATCADRECWSSRERGFLYRDEDASADGVRRMRLLGGIAGEPSIVLDAANDSTEHSLDLPSGIAAALSGSSRATVQIHGSDLEECFSVTLDEVVKDGDGIFRARR
jgi:uncharacterized delta-60 repeat protein